MSGGRRVLFMVALLALPAGQAVTCFSQETPAASLDNPPQAKPDITEIPVTPTPPPPMATTRKLPPIQIPNFISCPLATLQHMVPELTRLKPAQDQTHLSELLDKIGAKTVEIVRKTPNLISRESVATDQGYLKTHQDFSYLVLQHQSGPLGIVLDEFRVDLKNGKQFETEEVVKAAESSSPAPSALELPVIVPSAPVSEEASLSQGFVNEWLHFYPSNQKESDFRYLG